MKSVSGKEVAKALERKGWELLRVHGSHHIYGRQDSLVRLSVPVHGNQPFKTGFLTHFMKAAALSEQEL